MTKKLVLSDGTRERELHLVGRIVVGRDPSCEISHDDALLSRRHAEFVTSGDTVSVRDLGSRNGVFVNGARASEQTLEAGDVVQIGPLRARFVVDSSPRSMSPEAMDTDRTAVLRTTAAPVAAAPAPVNPAVALAFEEVDEDATRLVPDPSGSRSASESAPLFMRPEDAAPLHEQPQQREEEDEDITRFSAAPAIPAPRPILRKVELPPRITSPEPTLVRAPAIAAMPAGDSLGTFVFGQILMLAVAMLGSGAIAIVMWSRAVPTDGSGAPSMSLAWFALPVAVAIAGTFVVGGAVNRRIASALSENDRART